MYYDFFMMYDVRIIPVASSIQQPFIQTVHTHIMMVIISRLHEGGVHQLSNILI